MRPRALGRKMGGTVVALCITACKAARLWIAVLVKLFSRAVRRAHRRVVCKNHCHECRCASWQVTQLPASLSERRRRRPLTYCCMIVDPLWALVVGLRNPKSAYYDGGLHRSCLSASRIKGMRRCAGTHLGERHNVPAGLCCGGRRRRPPNHLAAQECLRHLRLCRIHRLQGSTM